MHSSCRNDVSKIYVDYIQKYDNILFYIERFVPLSYVKSSNHPPWYNKRILNLKKKNKINRTKGLWSLDTALTVKLFWFVTSAACMYKLSYKTYTNGVQNIVASDPKKFWHLYSHHQCFLTMHIVLDPVRYVNSFKKCLKVFMLMMNLVLLQIKVMSTIT